MTTATGGSAAGGSSVAPRWHRVCAAADLAEGTAIGTEIEGVPVCVVRSGGAVYAVRDECSHADVMLSQGEAEDGKIECWLHGSQFDLASGVPLSLPAIEPVPTYAVTIDGDDVLVDVTHSNPERG
ncbi:ferredoxin subunit of nitrite reductase and ring-hydroxylating dioxygenase [Frankia casuarinae]|uniref:Rieske (2Fe-2S) protein n=1 Tax=Frankia casuarinae (strain DSM 45818 / CECT 9043 / HFP020203 / CcI3) TaxID=106370 RepID=Q2JCF4_FRACC|nr:MULTISPECIES: non-heme iron oxygenase ferredoxin subunit [Frankia]ABD11038.1 Rieske (2Fe-2S) protein [Frankia casuarinae]ETA00952.1 ferredoxin subunit of nitrite reductase and ring-hydroxylating dioxygenase [Frankia sp. CcI6]EYT91060.1 ferredoxin subunit of nitrite reductase and ring-hydroxylating dioxygenase [Frankia casuarinae]KDA41942.1 ferredoxin subunit of nitrite reductase and ring-hydroxylating dioxygenase [Frankia sp. BMG5.23]KEZ37442.1 ferredoxin subunit of nitrite reductase and ri